MRHLKILALAIFVGIVGCESQEAARRRKVAYNLKQLGLALDAYNLKHPEIRAKKESDANDQAPGKDSPKAEDMDRRAERTMKVSGEVAEFHRSPDSQVDGITLKDGMEVRFPPKSGEAVAAAVSIGDKVEIVGWMHAGESEVHAATVTNAGSGKAVEVDELPPGPPE